ncbi:MAG: dihydroorotate dehydrogenase-like protein [Verrucomicrobiota bacterium]
MTDLKTSYMGLELKNPVIAGASGLTAETDSIKQLEESGVAAVVVKSLFEEEIELERFKYEKDLDKNNYRHPEMITVHPHPAFAGPEEYLQWLSRAREKVDIPLIGSLNAVRRETWLDYAVKIEQAGVDAIECNLFSVPGDPGKDGAAIEREQVELAGELKKALSIPLSLKLSYFYANPLNIIQRLDKAGADGLVLFNRIFEPDLDIDKMEHIAPFNFSHETDYRLPMRYAGLMEGNVKADICCSNGIFSGGTAAKMILAGASAVQVVSALFVNGHGHVETMISELSDWMEKNGYGSPADFKGRMSKRHSNDPGAYTRAHYARLLMNPRRVLQDSFSM